MGREIFLSYRRTDTGAYTRAIFNHLDQRFPERVFLDWEGVEVGEDFVAKLEEMAKSSGVLLALIGQDWLACTDGEGKQRIGLPGDHVRREIERALEHDVALVPVLFDGTSIPSESDLPDSLKPLATRNAISISSANYAGDIDRLTRGIERILGENEEIVIHVVREEVKWTSLLGTRREINWDFHLPWTPRQKKWIEKWVDPLDPVFKWLWRVWSVLFWVMVALVISSVFQWFGRVWSVLFWVMVALVISWVFHIPWTPRQEKWIEKWADLWFGKVWPVLFWVMLALLLVLDPIT